MRSFSFTVICCVCVLCQLSSADDGKDPKSTRIYVNEGEELLVHMHQHEGLLRRQVYREASIQAQARRERYIRDKAKAEKSLAAFKTELNTLENAKDVNIDRLETVLNGIGEAEKIVTICTEGLLVVETAIEQMAKFKEELKFKCLQYRIDFNEADIHAGFRNILQSFLVKRSKMGT